MWDFWALACLAPPLFWQRWVGIAPVIPNPRRIVASERGRGGSACACACMRAFAREGVGVRCVCAQGAGVGRGGGGRRYRRPPILFGHFAPDRPGVAIEFEDIDAPWRLNPPNQGRLGPWVARPLAVSPPSIRCGRVSPFARIGAIFRPRRISSPRNTWIYNPICPPRLPIFMGVGNPHFSGGAYVANLRRTYLRAGSY